MIGVGQLSLRIGCGTVVVPGGSAVNLIVGSYPASLLCPWDDGGCVGVRLMTSSHAWVGVTSLTGA